MEYKGEQCKSQEINGPHGDTIEMNGMKGNKKEMKGNETGDEGKIIGP